MRAEVNVNAEEELKPPKIKYRLVFKIFTLIAVIIMAVIAVSLYSSLKTYQEDMYKQLLKRSTANIKFIMKALQEPLTSKQRIPKDKEIAFLEKRMFPRDILRIFEKSVNDDNSIQYIVAYLINRKVIFYPETYGANNRTGDKYKLKVYIKKQKISGLNKYFMEKDCRFNPRTGCIEYYRNLNNNLGTSFGSVLMGVSPETIKKGILKTITYSAGIGAIIIVAGLVLSYIFARLLIYPISQLNKTAKEITGGNLAKRAVLRTSDEIAELGYSFNKMTASLDKKIHDLKAVEDLSKEISANKHELNAVVRAGAADNAAAPIKFVPPVILIYI